MRRINYPLIVSDFDGTLVNEDGTISEKNKKAIAEYIEAGGKFAISTGRLPDGIISRAKELGLKGLVSTCQGAIILDIESGDLILEGKMSNEISVKVLEKMEELDLHVHAYDLWDYYSNKDDEALALYERIVKSKATLVLDKPLSQFYRERGVGVYKLLVMVKSEDNAKIFSALENEKFEGCCVTKSGDFLVEVVNATYSKGTAVRFLAEHYGVSLDKTIAIGDQLNDVAMIETAGLGVAVQNADERLKKVADYIFEYTNEEGAVAEIIERFGFYEE